MGEPSNLSTVAMNPRVGCRQYLALILKLMSLSFPLEKVLEKC